jgi:ERCC4-type nuclease
MLDLIIDNREANLITRLKERELEKYLTKISIEVKQLDIGDIHIVSNEKTWIIERKTVNDLLASVKDGRYKEQKTRMLASGYDITYIIEGDDILCGKSERNHQLLSSIYIYSMYRDKIHLVFTKSIEETATYILTMCTKIIDKPEKFVTSECHNYINCIKMKKMDNVTPENCFLMQLSQIPTISVTIAKNIQKSYSSMKDFIKAMENVDETQDRINMLCKIEKIGKEKAKKILEYMQFI